MNENDVKKDEREIGLIIGEQLYEKFYKELTTALTNSIRNFNYAMFSDITPSNVYYYKGKMDAFKEISERITKEHQLARQPLDSDDTALKLYEKIRRKKNEDIDRILPPNKYRGRYSEGNFRRFCGQIADLLEAYGNLGFDLGRKYERNEMKDSDITEFNPEEFEKVCVETFCPEMYEIF